MKVIVKFNKTEYVNIPADELQEENGFVYVYKGGLLRGIFSVQIIDMIYLSEVRE